MHNNKRLYHLVQSVLLIVIIAAVFLSFKNYSIIASDIINRSVSIGDSSSSANTNHIFTFSLLGGTNVGSIKFQYCSNSPIFDDTCDIPSGVNVSSPNLTSQSGEIGFTIDLTNTNTNTIVLSRPVSVITVAGQSSYRFDNLINPSDSNKTYYVRISTYSSSDGSGSYLDRGSVVFSINNDLTVNAYVPPFLVFCAAQTLSGNCSSATGYNLNMGILSTSVPSLATSQIGGASNSFSGYSVYAIGYTMTSGNNIIPSLNSPSQSIPGTSQFGINLRGNTSPAIGNDVIGPGTLSANSGYDMPNKFKYINNDSIAKSTLSTDYNILTVSYLANVAEEQPAGIYTTTITYLAVATF